MDPITRKETYLAKLSGQDVSIPSPITREEFYLAKLCGEDVTVPTPITIDEYYLAALCGEVNSVPYPVTRLQMIWAKLLEMNVADVTPVTREETIWAGITLAEWVIATGNPVTFTAVAVPFRQMKIAFSPVQDLHGYDAPWPAGGGVNKWDEFNGYWAIADGSKSTSGTALNYQSSQKIKTSEGDVFYLTKDLAHTACYVVYWNNGAFVSGASASLSELQPLTIPSGVDEFAIDINFGSQANALAAKVMLSKGATAPTAWTPYSNECPISGWTGVNVWQAGKNLYNPPVTPNGSYYSYSDGVYTISRAYRTGGTILYGHTASGEDEPLTGMNGKTVTVSVDVYLEKTAETPSHNTVRYGLKNNTANGGYSIITETVTVWDTWVRLSHTFTAPDAASGTPGYLYFGCQPEWPDSGFNLKFRNIQIEAGSTAHDFVPYDPGSQLIPVAFPDGETYYFGWVDPTTGVGEVTMASKDLGDLNWVTGSDSTGQYFRASSPTNLKYPNASGVPANAICERYPISASNNVYNASLATGWSSASPSSVPIYVRDFFCETLTAFQTAIAGTKLVYELKVPIPISLTPQQINSLAGTNNMWTDADTLTVEYRKDGNVSDVEALSMLLGGRYTPATGPEDVSDAEALSIITGGNR